MNREDYEKYRKNGGFYEIPVEIFNELLDEREEFIKWLKYKIELLKQEACTYGHLIDKTISEEINLKIYIYQEVLDKYRGVINE